MQITEVIPEGVPQAYFNGYAIGNSLQDFAIVLAQNGRPIIALNTTPAHAKALGEHLLRMVGELEKKTGQTIQAFAGSQQGPIEAENDE